MYNFLIENDLFFCFHWQYILVNYYVRVIKWHIQSSIIDETCGVIMLSSHYGSHQCHPSMRPISLGPIKTISSTLPFLVNKLIVGSNQNDKWLGSQLTKIMETFCGCHSAQKWFCWWYHTRPMTFQCHATNFVDTALLQDQSPKMGAPQQKQKMSTRPHYAKTVKICLIQLIDLGGTAMPDLWPRALQHQATNCIDPSLESNAAPLH